jgi:hypothetical protein
MCRVYALVENNAQKNHSQNRLRYFYQPDLRSLNNSIFTLFSFSQLKYQKLYEVYYTVKKAFSTPFQRYVTHPIIPNISVAKLLNKQICSRLATSDHAYEKNRNPNSFCYRYSTSDECAITQV